MKPLILWRPSSSQKPPAGFQVCAQASWIEGALSLDFEVRGDLSALSLGRVPAGHGCLRQDHLWRGTCFEAFLRVGENPEYLEINFTPFGGWNVYHFEGYRQGMRPVTLERDPKVTLENETGFILVGAEFKFEKNSPWDRERGSPIRAGLAAVIEERNPSTSENLSYWALKHTGSQPDFHRADSFVLKLGPVLSSSS